MHVPKWTPPTPGNCNVAPCSGDSACQCFTHKAKLEPKYHFTHIIRAFQLAHFAMQDSINFSSMPKINSRSRVAAPKRKKKNLGVWKGCHLHSAIQLKQKENKSLAWRWRSPQRQQGIYAVFWYVICQAGKSLTTAKNSSQMWPGRHVIS